MPRKPPDKFTLHVPDEQEPERQMPARLEVVDTPLARKRSKSALGGGAYNPYERTDAGSDTSRTRKPRVDLRKLSEWIKTTQQVKTLKEGDAEPDKPAGE